MEVKNYDLCLSSGVEADRKVGEILKVFEDIAICFSDLNYNVRTYDVNRFLAITGRVNPNFIITSKTKKGQEAHIFHTHSSYPDIYLNPFKLKLSAYVTMIKRFRAGMFNTFLLWSNCEYKLFYLVRPDWMIQGGMEMQASKNSLEDRVVETKTGLFKIEKYISFKYPPEEKEFFKMLLNGLKEKVR